MATICPVGQELLANSNVIGAWFWRRGVTWDPWDNYVERLSKDLYSGYNMRYTIQERITPQELVTQTVAQPDGNVSACDPPITQLNWQGLTAKTLVMDTGGFRTPQLCLEDLRDAVNAQMTIDGFVQGLSEQRDYTFYRQHQTRFTNAAGNKVVIGLGTAGSDPVSATSIPAVAATGTLTYNRLKYAWESNVQQGGDVYPYAMVDGAPIFQCFLGYEAKEQLIRNNEALRTDIRFGQPQLLQDPLGRQITPYRDFSLQTIKYPARYNFINGAYVEVLPFLAAGTGATTVGVTSNLNPTYQAATFEAAYLFNTETYKMAVPTLPPVRWGKGEIVFTPQNYNGEWRFINVTSANCIAGQMYTWNEFGDKVYAVSKFEFGSVIPRPELGWVWIYKRCGFGNDSISCSS